VKRRALVTAFLLLVCLASHANAQAARSLALSFEGCRDEDAAEIRRLVAIDFGALVATSRATYALSIRCRDTTWDLGIPAVALARSLDFVSTPESARARLTAIVVGELVAEASTERQVKPTKPSAPAVVQQAPPEQDRLSRPERPKRFRLGVTGGGRTLLGGVPRLLGGAARFDDLLIPWSVDALFEQGAVTTSEGVVSVRTLSGGLALSWQQALGAGSVRAGAGVRAGAVWMQGTPSDRSEVHGQALLRGWAGPMLTSLLALPLKRPLVFTLVVEGGYTLLPVYGLVDGRREAALRGFWLGAQIGAGLQL